MIVDCEIKPIPYLTTCSPLHPRTDRRLCNTWPNMLAAANAANMRRAGSGCAVRGNLHGVSDAQPCQFRNWIVVPAFNKLAATGGQAGKGGDAPVTRESKREGQP